MIFHMAHEADPQPFQGTRRELSLSLTRYGFSSDACGSGPNGTSLRLTLSVRIERGTLQRQEQVVVRCALKR